MGLFGLAALTLTTAAVLAWANHRFVRLPTTIGVMLIALGMSLGLIAGRALGIDATPLASELLGALDFKSLILDVMLAFLLFAGSLTVDLDDLLGQKRIVGLLATVGVAVSTLLVGGMIWLAARALGLQIDWLSCLLFGALISPTDPIAVLGILKTAGAPKSLANKMAGESLFNDGIGVVVYTVLLAFAVGGSHGEPASAAMVGELMAVEIGGAVLIGLVGGWLAYAMLRSVDDYKVEVLVTLAAATGLYALASALHSSGPITVVIAGLFIGNTGRSYAMSPRSVAHLDTFWELVDEILNVVLFVLLGMEALLLSFSGQVVLAGLVAVPLVLLARGIAVGGTVALMRRRREFTPHVVKILTWGGLRGAISVALALSLPETLPARELLIGMTYVVVIFSIVVQGLTIGRLVRRIAGPDEAA